MKVINIGDYSIFIRDVGVTVPASKFGAYNFKDGLFISSGEVGPLIKSGKLSAFFDGPLNGLRIIRSGEDEMYIVPGEVVWEGKGLTVPTDSSNLFNKMTFEEFQSLRKNYCRDLPNRYIVTRACDMNVSLEKLSCILNKQNPSIEISEEYYKSNEIQSGISSGKISVSKVLAADVNELGYLIYKEKEIHGDQTFCLEESNKSKEYENVHCIWEGPILDTGGYANMNRQYLFNLNRLGVSIKPIIGRSDNSIESPIRNRILRLSQTEVRSGCPKVFATNFPSNYSGKIIAYTMMETELTIHKDLVKKLTIADEIWVPSQWNKETFERSGIKKDIQVMPLGVDSEIYKPRSKSVNFSFPVKKYVFYAVSTWIWRKGWDVLLKAYSKAFTSDDDVSLVIFSHVPAKSPEMFSTHIKNHIKFMFPEKEMNKFPHLAIITSILPDWIVPKMYNSADCFVLFSRGEGWGLPYCEAAASGIPVIGANHGGQKMFLNDYNSLLVKPDLVSPCHPSLLYMTDHYKGMKFANYSEDAIKEAAKKMRYAYEHQDEMKIKANLCRENLINNFLWDKCSLRVADRLKDFQ